MAGVVPSRSERSVFGQRSGHAMGPPHLENSTMAHLTVKPTAKFLKAGAILAALVFLGLEIAYLTQWQDQVGRWVMILPPLILLWPLARWIRRSFSKATITGDRLRYETGF